jgi:menaquinone-dependent protoporphyrinogen oxidase
MAYLILYMSRHGTTEKVAQLLKDKLGKSRCSLINLAENPKPDLNLYETVIIGGSIHVGHIQKEIADFCHTNQDILLTKHLGLFICFMEKEKGQLEFNMAFPEMLRKHAKAQGLFGGELLFEKMNFIERTIIRKIKKVKSSVSDLDYEAINAFAASLLKG